MGEPARAEPAGPARGRGLWAPHHSPLSLDPEAFVPGTKPGGSAVLRPASLSSGRDGVGSLGLTVDSAPSMGPGIAGWPYALEAPCYPRKWGCGG